MKSVTVVVAGDPHQLTGGYIYDARIAIGLRRAGWTVAVEGLAGRFPDADDTAAAALDAVLARQHDDALVVVDGLALGGLPAVAESHAARLRLVALVHHPLADETGLAASTREHLEQSERRALQAVARVVVTSHFTARRLAAFELPRDRLHVVEPGVAPARPAAGSSGSGCQLLCVATLIPRKGHDVLIDALARVADLDWHCDCVGALDRDPDFRERIAARIDAHGLADRIRLRGTYDAEALDGAYHAADLFVLASHYEGYGMVISEAIAHGLPVVTTTGGALADTLPAGAGRQVEPGDVAALAGALRAMIGDSGIRAQAREAALAARRHLRDWDAAADEFAAILEPLLRGAVA